MPRERWLEFVWLPTFEASAKKLLNDDSRRAIEAALCDDLDAGTPMRRTGGFRKLRYALEGGGKSGGVRIIYLPDKACGRKLAHELKNEEC